MDRPAVGDVAKAHLNQFDLENDSLRHSRDEAFSHSLGRMSSFANDRLAQGAEANELQAIEPRRNRRIGNLVAKDGDRIDGGEVTVSENFDEEGEPSDPMKVSLDGASSFKRRGSCQDLVVLPPQPVDVLGP